MDPFSTSFPKQISRGDRIDDSIVNDRLQGLEVGMTQFKAFHWRATGKGKGQFYSPIKKNKLQTGIKKKKKTPKAVEVLKRDCQAFRTTVSKSLTLEEDFQYPITSVRERKRHFQNFLIGQRPI